MSRKKKKQQAAEEAYKELTDAQLEDVSGGLIDVVKTPFVDSRVALPYPGSTDLDSAVTKESGDGDGGIDSVALDSNVDGTGVHKGEIYPR
jgi:hypothetical protein